MADVQIPQTILEAHERGGLLAGAASELGDLSWLAYEPGDDEREAELIAGYAARRERGERPVGAPDPKPRPVTATEGYPDESDQLWVGRLFTLIRSDGSYDDSYERWLAAQNLGAAPYTLLGRHHTAGPGTLTSLERYVKGCFDYYFNERGWRPWGKGPHAWMLEMPDGSVLLYIATHPRQDGIHISYRNHRSYGLEVCGNHDKTAPSPRLTKGIRIFMWVSSRRVGHDLKIITPPDRGVDGSPTWQGELYHRDAKTNLKSCPGWAVTHEREDPVVLKPWPEPPPPPPAKPSTRIVLAPAARKAYVAGPGARARNRPSLSGTIVYELVEGRSYAVAGYTVEGGQVVNGSGRWFKLDAGNYVHSSGFPGS